MEDYTSPNVVTLFLTTLLLITFMTSPISATTTTTTPAIKASKKFIKISCNSTTYSPVCYSSLAPYASTIKTSPFTLCTTAVAVTIKNANITSALVTKLATRKGITAKEVGPIKDCLVNIKDTIYRLKECLNAMTKIRGANKEFQMNNAKTWASAAITDEMTCYDALSGNKVDPVVKQKIRTSIQKTDQLNSNALYLINHLKY